MRLGVIGWPVAHSRSPAMFKAAFAELGMAGWSYQRLPLPAELFEETTKALVGAGFKGANVTIPHKQAALALAHRASETARAIGAANTLTFEPDGAITAENTDAPGLIAALARTRGGPATPAGLRALVLGAGGSARAAVWALQNAGAAEVSIWNRSPKRARELADSLGARAVSRPQSADLLVNCTSVGLQPALSDEEALNQLAITADQVGEYPYVVDLVYRKPLTPLVAAARAGGAHAVEGLEVLVAQGALSFELWTGLAAPLAAMRAGAGID
jgi:shikimate dehydrogenase